MTAASKNGLPVEVASQGYYRPPSAVHVARGRCPRGRTLGESTRGGRRGKGPGEYVRVAEITLGRAICQQGLATTCKDLVHNGRTGGGRRGMVWRMSP